MTSFDTLAIARDLRQHGFTQDQAEAVADAVHKAAGVIDVAALATKGDLAALATKADLAATKADILLVTKTDLANAKAEIKIDLDNTKFDILKWVFTMIVFALLINVATVIALVTLLRH